MKRRLLSAAAILCILVSMIPQAQAWTSLEEFVFADFGRAYEVFSGPGYHYYRAANGKATYGGGAARVFGKTANGWLMIGYGTSGGKFRIGYISQEAILGANYIKGDIRDLTFDSYIYYADNYCKITDDPILNNEMLCTLPENTAVTVLGTMYDFMYVEAQTKLGLMRGFVWREHLKSNPGPKPTPMNRPTPTPLPTARPWPTAVPKWYYQQPTAVPQWYYQLPTAVPQWYYQLPTAAPQWSQPTQQPAYSGVWLPSPVNIYLNGSQPVYSGPSEFYYRANNSKATKGQGTCQVYGIENKGYGDWALIGYTLNGGKYRIGFIKADSLTAAGYKPAALNLDSQPKKLIQPAVLTDDPVHYQPAVAQLPEGTYALFLGYLSSNSGVWAYVEVISDNQIMRGFVPAYALEQ